MMSLCPRPARDPHAQLWNQVAPVSSPAVQPGAGASESSDHSILIPTFWVSPLPSLPYRGDAQVGKAHSLPGDSLQPLVHTASSLCW